jgi:hypothetical protein
MIPKSLKAWFIAHFLIDWIVGIPLLIDPVWATSLFNITITNSLMARLVAAAFIVIGGISFAERKAHKESFKTLLNFKIAWSLFAIVALVIELISGGPKLLFWPLGIFVVFHLVWVRYRLKLFN